MLLKTQRNDVIKKTLPLLTSAAIVACTGGSAWGFSLVGTKLELGITTQWTPTSEIAVNTSPVSAIVGELAVEFPNNRDLFNIRDFPGFAFIANIFS
jgi:hypothetical protein